MKLSDYIFEFLSKKEIRHVFMLPGGGCMHLVDSLGRSKDISYLCTLHEQAAAIAAESYGQHTNHLGVCLVTSGPGATNTLTGVTAAWIDSTPVLFISGQAKRSDLMKDSGVRQMGSQEVDIVSMVQSVTKYSVMVMDPSSIRYHLERAYYEATTGRKGPVWLDIPLDVQAAEIDPNTLSIFEPNHQAELPIVNEVDEIISLLNQSKRPLVLAGNGIKLSGCSDIFLDIANELSVPLLTTWKMIDLIEYEHPLFFGMPGSMGNRGSNFILQNCDLLIILGSRLDSSLTAFNQPNFAPKAKKVMIDIDKNEIQKMTIELAISLAVDLKYFLSIFKSKTYMVKNIDRSSWLSYCLNMKNKFDSMSESHVINDKDNSEFVNTYIFIDTLCQYLNCDDIIVPESSGSAGEVTYQAFKLKKGQKMKNAAGLGSMGFGLPYAIGASFSHIGKRVILINGDGAFQLNIQELQTVKSNNLPIKIFIWNNNGYASIMATQRNLFDGYYVASEEKSGLSLPNILKLAQAYGLETFSIKNNQELHLIKDVLESDGPVLCEINVSPFQTTAPKVMSVKMADGNMMSKPLEDMWPFLSEDELNANMII